MPRARRQPFVRRRGRTRPSLHGQREMRNRTRSASAAATATTGGGGGGSSGGPGPASGGGKTHRGKRGAKKKWKAYTSLDWRERAALREAENRAAEAAAAPPHLRRDDHGRIRTDIPLSLLQPGAPRLASNHTAPPPLPPPPLLVEGSGNGDAWAMSNGTPAVMAALFAGVDLDELLPVAAPGPAESSALTPAQPPPLLTLHRSHSSSLDGVPTDLEALCQAVWELVQDVGAATPLRSSGQATQVRTGSDGSGGGFLPDAGGGGGDGDVAAAPSTLPSPPVTGDDAIARLRRIRDLLLRAGRVVDDDEPATTVPASSGNRKPTAADDMTVSVGVKRRRVDSTASCNESGT